MQSNCETDRATASAKEKSRQAHPVTGKKKSGKKDHCTSKLCRKSEATVPEGYTRFDKKKPWERIRKRERRKPEKNGHADTHHKEGQVNTP